MSIFHPLPTSAPPPSHGSAPPHQHPSSIQVTDCQTLRRLENSLSNHPPPTSTLPPSHGSAPPHQHPSSIQVTDHQTLRRLENSNHPLRLLRLHPATVQHLHTSTLRQFKSLIARLYVDSRTSTTCCTSLKRSLDSRVATCRLLAFAKQSSTDDKGGRQSSKGGEEAGCYSRWLSTYQQRAQVLSERMYTVQGPGRAGPRPFSLALTLTLRAGPPSAWPLPEAKLTRGQGRARACPGPCNKKRKKNNCIFKVQ